MRSWLVRVLATGALAGACRATHPSVVVETGPPGQDGTGYTVQCSGWFPDWIAKTQPANLATTFRLAQGYPLGFPVFVNGPNGTVLDHWDPPAPFTSAPWLAFDFHVPAQQAQYLEALKNYALEDLVPFDFVTQNVPLGKKRWYHVPMMTSGNNPRESQHGLTSERLLRNSEQSWTSVDLRSYGIGFYNALGGYTIGKVFKDPEPSNSDPTAAQFIDGTLVFKVLFAEYKPGSMTGADPFLHAPEWQVQPFDQLNNTTFPVRLLQMDIAVRDPRAAITGWVFATYVYDDALPAATPQDRWYNLKPVGLQWGNDPDVDAPNDPDLNETATAGFVVPAPFQNHLGRHGRLNGPVDNPESACMSCHSTAQVRDGQTSAGAYKAAGIVPPAACTASEQMYWFRNFPGNQPFGNMTNPPSPPNAFCVPQNPALGSPPMHALDFSLQIQLGLVNGVALDHHNPCLAQIPPDLLPSAQKTKAARRAQEQPEEARRSMVQREAFLAPVQLDGRKLARAPEGDRTKAKLATWKELGMELSSEDAENSPHR